MKLDPSLRDAAANQSAVLNPIRQLDYPVKVAFDRIVGAAQKDLSGCVDIFSVLRRSELADGIKAFKSEADAVNRSMAPGTLGDWRDVVQNRSRVLRVGSTPGGERSRSGGGGRSSWQRRPSMTKIPSSNRVVEGEETRYRQNASSLFRRSGSSLPIPLWRFYPVKHSELLIDEAIVAGYQ